ncbi:MAG: hypothetical protein NTW19_09980 [Planctomycetota bacterium]|nr:hypothetical protein [Planctomycetota bacterium]
MAMAIVARRLAGGGEELNERSIPLAPWEDQGWIYTLSASAFGFALDPAIACPARNGGILA